MGDGGPALGAYIGIPYGLALDASGSLYIAQANRQNNLIRKVSGGVISTIAGGGQGAGVGVSATTVSLARPLGVAVDSSGNVYIAEAGGNRVRMVSPGGTITTVAGNGAATVSGDGGPATQAGLNGPYHVAVDSAGYVFVSEIGDGIVRMVSPDGTIATIGGMLDRPAGIAVGSGGQVYLVEDSASIPAVLVVRHE